MTFEFSRDRKMMSVLAQRNGTGVLYAKGAPESILERCSSVLVNGRAIPLVPQLRNALLQSTIAYGSQGLRTLALAYADNVPTDLSHYRAETTAE